MTCVLLVRIGIKPDKNLMMTLIIVYVWSGLGRRVPMIPLESNSSVVIGTLQPEPDQTQIIIYSVVFKFLTSLMPILTSNTHVTAYLGN